MEFKKIQLNGFKSFAEKTAFIIDKGLPIEELVDISMKDNSITEYFDHCLKRLIANQHNL